MSQQYRNKYKHLFFDLDHTLWDFERNSAECLAEIYDVFNFKSLNSCNLSDFQKEFSIVNQFHWSLLEKKLITQEELRSRRFKETLSNLGILIDDAFSLKINNYFLEVLPTKAHLIEGTIELLEYLRPNYTLHIISNGWQQIQVNKMQSSAILSYFQEIITNELVGARKPDKQIFDYALAQSNALLENSLMIGDNYEADILGAIGAEMDTVFYNPDSLTITRKPTFEIKKLIELKEIL